MFYALDIKINAELKFIKKYFCFRGFTLHLINKTKKEKKSLYHKNQFTFQDL